MATAIELKAAMLYMIYNQHSSRQEMIDKFVMRLHQSSEKAEKLLDWCAAAVAENEPRRKFVVSFMHYSGENYGKLDNQQMYDVYCEADGFGKCSRSQLLKLNGGWDWSHIRDSTIDGWRRMEAKINSFGFERE